MTARADSESNSNSGRKPLPPALAPLEGLCKRAAETRRAAAERIREIRARRKKATRRLLPGLRERVAEASAALDDLGDWIEDHKHLFERPRTRAFEGIKAGLRKEAGTICIADEERTVKLIKAKLPRLAKTLLKTKVTISKTALRKLSAAELAAVGVTIEDATDRVLIAPAPDDLDAVVDALMARLDGGAEPEADPEFDLDEGREGDGE